MPLSPAQESAARALVSFLGYQSGHAQNEACGFPAETALAISEHALDRVNAAQAIKDELARLYDLRRDGHVRQLTEEIAYQRARLAARIMIERETGCCPDDSLEATALLSDGELAQIAALQTEPNCRPQIDAVFAAAGVRRKEELAAAEKVALEQAQAQQKLDEDAARVAADAQQKAVEEATPQVATPPAAPVAENPPPPAAGDVAGAAPLPSDK